MSSLLKKMHYKAMWPLHVLHCPNELVEVVNQAIEHHPYVSTPVSNMQFVWVFVLNQNHLKTVMPAIFPSLANDAYLWVAYPKKTSKSYKTDLTRDHGWDLFGQYGYEPVSLISFNDDFSIFRFRHVSNIKTMIRSETMKLTSSK